MKLPFDMCSKQQEIVMSGVFSPTVNSLFGLVEGWQSVQEEERD